MKCIACGRPLTRYAATIPSKDGLVGWGPKCAEKVLVKVKAERQRGVKVYPRRARPRRDDGQADLFGASA